MSDNFTIRTSGVDSARRYYLEAANASAIAVNSANIAVNSATSAESDRELAESARQAAEDARDVTTAASYDAQQYSISASISANTATVAANTASQAAEQTTLDAASTADDRAVVQSLRDDTAIDRSVVQTLRDGTATDRAAVQVMRNEAESFSTIAVTSGQSAANSATQANIFRGQTEAAFAVASGGVAGFLQKAGGFIFATTLYATTGASMVGGLDIQGRLIAYDPASQTYFAVGSTTSAAITAALGYTPASTTALNSLQTAAGTTGFLQRAGNFFMTRIVHGPLGSIFTGQDVYGRTVSWDPVSSEYSLITPISATSITTALGYTPANTNFVNGIAAASGTSGFAQRASNNILVQSRYIATGNSIIGGTDVFGRTVALLDGQYVITGSGQSNIIAEPVPPYVALPASPTIKQYLRGTYIRWPDRIMMLIGWGQSLALGGNAVPYDETFSIVALNPGWSLMFDQGPWPERGDINSIIDLRNPANNEPRGGIGRTGVIETLGPRMFDVVQRRLYEDLGQYQRMLWSVAGAGGAPLYTLKRGTPVYNELLRLVERGAALSKSQYSRQLYLPGIVVIHGEADGFCPPAEYARGLVRLRQDLEEDIRAITGQTEPVRLLMTQPVRGSANAPLDPGTPNGMILASDIDPYCVVIGPKYHSRWDPVYDGTHPLAIGYAHIAETYGHAVGDMFYGRGFVPVRIEEAYWTTPTTLQLQYTRPVVLDSSGASLPTEGVTNWGYEVVQRAAKTSSSLAGDSLTITNVSTVNSSITATVSNTTVTFGGTTTRIPFGITVKVGANTYDVRAGQNDTLADIATVFAETIPNCTANGSSITISTGSPITASVASTLVNITVANTPTTMARIGYSLRGKGLVRAFETLGVSAIPGNPLLHHWALCELRDVPKF